MAARRPPPTHRVRVENEMIRRREKQSRYEEMWNGRKEYYEKWEKKNSKFDEWTSPRYYETHGEMIEKIKKQKEHEDNLQKRREKLRKLLNDEEQLYQVEMMVRKTKSSSAYRRPKVDTVPAEVLKELNTGLKIEEDERRRHEAELKLYHQWRNSNPILKHYERMQKNRDLKLSWLDQQIENRMRKEKEEEECRRFLKERDKMLKEEQAKEEQFQKQLQQKKEQLRRDLDEQVEELKKKSQMVDNLHRQEEENYNKKLALEKIELQRLEEQKLKRERECALFNIKQHKMKLKKRAEEMLSSLEFQKEMIMKLKQLEVAESFEDEVKKAEIKEAIHQFLVLNEEQKNLEKCRQKHLDFLFDSEAKIQYEQQEKCWREEEAAREKLIKDVLRTVQKQIEANIAKKKEEQIALLKEQEDTVRKIEEYNREMEALKEEEARRKIENLRLLNDEVKLKNVHKQERENEELKKIDQELEQVRREEERLKREIMNIQRRQGPIRPSRSRLFF